MELLQSAFNDDHDEWKLPLCGRITYRHCRQTKLPDFIYSSNTTSWRLMRRANNNNHAEIKVTASTPPASNEELSPSRAYAPSPVLSSTVRSGKSCPRATCTTCGHIQNMACTCLSSRERESIRDGCREWRCCDTDQSPSTSTMPSRSHPTPSQISERTMLQEVLIIHQKTQHDGVSTRPISQKKFEATF